MVTDGPKDTSQSNTESPNNPSAAQEQANKQVKNLATTGKSVKKKIELKEKIQEAKEGIEKELSPFLNLLTTKIRPTTPAQEQSVEKNSTEPNKPQ